MRSYFWRLLWGQSGHWKGFAPRWIRQCFWRMSFLPNFFPQCASGQMNRPSGVLVKLMGSPYCDDCIYNDKQEILWKCTMTQKTCENWSFDRSCRALLLQSKSKYQQKPKKWNPCLLHSSKKATIPFSGQWNLFFSQATQCCLPESFFEQGQLFKATFEPVAPDNYCCLG